MSNARVAEFWQALKARIDTATLGTIQGGMGRVYVPSDSVEDLDPATAAAGRTVILPVDTLWPVTEGFTSDLVPFLVRTDRNEYDAPGYDALVSAEAAQAEIYRRIQRWLPTGFVQLLVAFQVYRRSPPQRLLVRDETRQIWFLSSVYQFEAAPLAVAS